MAEIVSREEWHEMLGRSRALVARLGWMRQEGADPAEIEAIERHLARLNRKIRSPRLLRVRGIDA